METSVKTDKAEKAIERETFNRKYEAKLGHHFQQEVKLEDNWVRVYGIIYGTCCTRDMKVAIKERPDYETVILDDPLQLLTTIYRIMHVPRKLTCPTLALLKKYQVY